MLNLAHDFPSGSDPIRPAPSDTMTDFWKSRTEGEFLGVGNKKIRWISLTRPQHQKVMIVVNGRTESYWKYQELFFDLDQQGYDIYALDHRGQGMSERLTNDSELGHVEQFDDYVTDLNTFITTLVHPEHYPIRHILAHSMGGAITTLYLSQYPHQLQKAVLSAPMHGIRLKPWLRPIAFPLARIADYFYDEPTYAPGQLPYINKPFLDNRMTHSAKRYKWSKALYEEKPELKLGGPSARWVWQAINAAERCLSHAPNIDIPVLILQGGADDVVDNKAHQAFNDAMIENGKHCELSVIASAKHELFCEEDQKRQQVLEKTFTFFETK